MTWAPEGLGLTIFQDRYSRFAGETWEQACKRVAEHVANAEENGKVQKYGERFEQELVNNRFMPGGRVWYGSGRPKAQLLNCFVVPTADSREGWGKTISDVIVVSGTGGGVGINCSPVRPRGSDIKGTGGKATGAVSIMQMIDKVGDVLVSGGGRRLALMLCLDVNHPDIEEFLNVKLDLNELTNANISIVLNTDTAAFVESVRTGADINFVFGGRDTGGSINARTLWDTIVKNAWKSGEPGVLNGHLANALSNISYYKPLVSTNPCGEIWLEEYGCCCLGALVLPRFIQDGAMDWDQLDESVRLGVRFLDDVLTVNQYPLPEIKENCETVRRIGLGVMGLHTMLLELGHKYSSEEGRHFIDTLFSFIKNTAYDASVTLAAEKGPFPVYSDKFLESGFTKTLKRGIRNKIREHGIRNCAILTIAPTGTTGMVSGVSTGIEPLFAPVYWRHYYKPTNDGSRELAKELVITPEFERFGELAEGAYDVSVRDHFEVQKIVQAHIDNAVSKTINLPKGYEVGDLADLWLSYLPYLKGSTFYREGSREFEPLEPVRMKDADLITKAAKGEIVYQPIGSQQVADPLDLYHAQVTYESNPVDQAAMDCVDGTCEVPWVAKEEAAETILV